MSILRHLVLSSLVAGFAVPSSSGADVLLTNGRTLQVTEWAADGGNIRLTFAGGGQMTLPRDQVRTIRPSDPIPSPPAEKPQVPAPGPDVAPTVTPSPAVAPPRSVSDTVGSPGMDIDAVIDLLAARHGVSPRLVRAVIEAESDWNPRAVSRAGAAGLMQLMPGTARGRGVTDPFDPEQNLDAGVAELAANLRRYSGEMSLALAAYNAGGQAVSRHGGIPPYRETLQYVRQVLDRYFTAADLPRLGPAVP